MQQLPPRSAGGGSDRYLLDRPEEQRLGLRQSKDDYQVVMPPEFPQPRVDARSRSVAIAPGQRRAIDTNRPRSQVPRPLAPPRSPLVVPPSRAEPHAQSFQGEGCPNKSTRLSSAARSATSGSRPSSVSTSSPTRRRCWQPSKPGPRRAYPGFFWLPTDAKRMHSKISQTDKRNPVRH